MMPGFHQLLDEHEMQPLDTLTFSCYLASYQLEPLAVARASGVPYATVWRIVQGYSVTSQHAQLVRQGLLRLTGVPYTVPILVVDEPEHRTKPLTDR